MALSGRLLAARRVLGDARVAALALGVLTTLVYGGHLDNPLVFDSAFWFSEDNLRALRNLSTTDRYLSKTITYWLFHLLGGRMDLFRAVHLGLHVVTAFILFVLVRRLMVRVGPGARMGAGSGPALVVALAFTLHPVQVYAVADPGQLEVVLAMLFGLLMLVTYLEALARSSRRLFALSVLLYLFAVLSKENVITIPAVAAALTLLERRPTWALIRSLWPWYCLYGLVALLVFTGELAQHAEVSRHTQGLHLRSAVTQGYLFFRYWFLWVVPHVGWMSIDLQYPLAPRLLAWPEVAGFVGFVVYPVGAGWLLLRGGRAGLVGFGLLWPWFLFLPELATTRVGEAFVLYRSYLWLGGALLALVASLAPLPGRKAGAVLLVACVGLGGLAHERLLTFRSAYAVWDDAVRKNQRYERRAAAAYRPYLNRGRALLDLNRPEAALRDFGIALDLKPGLPYAHFNRGLALIPLGRLAEALAAFDQGLTASQGVPALALARAHSNRAGLYLLLGRSQDALLDLERAAALNPGRAEYRENLERLRTEVSR